MKLFDRVSLLATRFFIFWIVLFAVGGFFVPALFKPLVPYISWMLGIVMFGMGLTLKRGDFYVILRRPKEVMIGVLAQFTLMPLIAFVLIRLVPVSPEIAVGIVLVGCSPGGTASNVITYLSRGDTVLSVTLTMACTLIAPLLTPTLVWMIASRHVPVDVSAMFLSIAAVILLPLTLGALAQKVLPQTVARVAPLMPAVSVLGIVTIVAAVIAVNQMQIAQSGLLLMGMVVVHNGLGLCLGYWVAKAAKMGLPQRKALSIEVGMQNSGLSVVLAQAHFSPQAALPGALFSVWHNIAGAMAAAYYRRRD